MSISTNHHRVGASLLLAAGLMVLASACTSQDAYAVAGHHAASRLGVAEASLRVTERTDLSSARHAVFRITERSGKRQLMVAVPSEGNAVLDSSMPDAFASLARSEDLGARFDQFGAARVAGWFGSFGGGRCGEPITARSKDVHVNAQADGGHELSFAFAGADHLEECGLVLDGHGRVEASSVRSRPRVSSNAF
jgi:hypothetical protein